MAHFRPMTRCHIQVKNPAGAARAFTLIEMLVVIAIIGILAALTVGVLPGISEKRTRSRVRAEMVAIETAINTYKEKQGFYPPDNPADVTQAPLFYELTGTDFAPGVPAFYTNILGGVVDSVTITNNLGVGGFLNCAQPGSSEARQNYFPTLKPSAYADMPSTPAVKLLVVPIQGTNGTFNPWRYNSSRPTHNADSYDLWVDVVLGGKTITIGNWK